jgi:hypothetical protein
MSESTKKPVGDRRAGAHSRGIWRNTADPEHHEAQTSIIESGVEARLSGSALHDVLEKIEALKQTALRGVEPILTDGAGI